MALAMLRPLTFPCTPVPGLVSIIIPTHQRDHLIGATLDSVRNQSYPTWELLVVEDASQGATESIVRDFSRTVSQRVQYERNAVNLGAAATRNVAFGQARGEFVALLDSDDRWLPYHLEQLVGTIGHAGTDIAYANVRLVEDGTDRDLGTYGPSPEEVHDFPVTLYRRNFVVPSASLMKREVLRRVGPWSDEYLYCEDFDFWLRCVCCGITFAHCDDVTCLYRKSHEGATTQKLAGTIEEVAYTIKRYMNATDLDGKRIREYAIENFVAASNLHLKSDPQRDPSADCYRGGQMLLEAWKFDWTQYKHLSKGLRTCVSEKLKEWLGLPREDRTRFQARIPNQPIPRPVMAEESIPARRMAA